MTKIGIVSGVNLTSMVTAIVFASLVAPSTLAQRLPEKLLVSADPQVVAELEANRVAFGVDGAEESIVRHRYASFRASALGIAGNQVMFNIFDDTELVFSIDRIEVVGRALVYVGKVKGDPLATIYIGRVEDAFYCHYSRMGANSVRIRSTESRGGKGVYLIEELDPRKVTGGCLHDLDLFGGTRPKTEIPESEERVLVAETEEPAMSMMLGGGQTYWLDLAVAYSINTSYYFGSNYAAEAAIATAVSEMNAALVQTQIAPPNQYKVRLVGTMAVGFAFDETATTGAEIWAKMHCQCDGLQGTEAWGDYLQADHIQLWYYDPHQTQQQGGADWLTTSNGITPNVRSKFSAIDSNIALGNTRFGALHEISHGLGVNHTWDAENALNPNTPMDLQRWELGAMGYESSEDGLIIPEVTIFSEIGSGGVVGDVVSQLTNPATTVPFGGQNFVVGRFGTVPADRPANAAATLAVTFPIVSSFGTCVTCPPKINVNNLNPALGLSCSVLCP